MIVYHIGYSDAHADRDVEALMEDPKMLIIDTRKVPYSWRSGWSRDDRCYIRSKEVRGWKPGMTIPDGGIVRPGMKSIWGKNYRWAGAVLGNRNYNVKGAPISIIDLDRGLARLILYLQEGYTPILLCECPVLYACHRYAILKALHEYMPEVEIRNADGTETTLYPEGVSLFGK